MEEYTDELLEISSLGIICELDEVDSDISDIDIIIDECESF